MNKHYFVHFLLAFPQDFDWTYVCYHGALEAQSKKRYFNLTERVHSSSFLSLYPNLCSSQFST